MHILALDTATEGCSVALWNGRDMISRFEQPGRGHAQLILTMVDDVMRESNIALADLSALAVGVGPGAFTGVRISVAVSKGLAFGANLPVVPVTSLEALGLQGLVIADPPTCVLACLDARLGEVYWCHFQADPMRGILATTPMRVSNPDEVSLCPAELGCFGIGRGMRVLKNLNLWSGPCDCDALPHAASIARLAEVRFNLGEAIDVARLAPLYLRDKVALTELERRPRP